MRHLIQLQIFVFLISSHLAFAESYSERREANIRDYFQKREAVSLKLAQTDNAQMLEAIERYAASKNSAVQAGTTKCPVRADIYRYGFSGAPNDAWTRVRYQHCEFNTTNGDACSIGMSFGYPIYVNCIDTQQKERMYKVDARGRVSLYSGR